MRAYDALNEALDAPRAIDLNGWLKRHHEAVYAPDQRERPILEMAYALARYADMHRRRYGSDLGEDGVLGPTWESMARGLLGLLNGETGRLDCGTVDGAIRAMGAAAGIGLTD